MTTPLGDAVDQLLAGPAYGLSAADRPRVLLDLLRTNIHAAAAAHPGYANYVAHWPTFVDTAVSVAELPYLPVAVFKQDPPLALVPPNQVTRVLTSSATTGQTPSRVALDAATARRLARGTTAILRDFLGPERRPYLVADEPAADGSNANLTARGAAIRGLAPFASTTTHALTGGTLDRRRLREFAAAHREQPVLVYGFTYLLWREVVEPLLAEGQCLGLERAQILHSGGWKRLQEQAVGRSEFQTGVARVFGCPATNVLDFYGLVENVGVVYPDCPHGLKHAPAFGEVVVRDPATLRPVKPGGTGLLQVCSVLPSSFPGHLLLTEDLATLECDDGCPCGRPGIGFRFAGRVAQAEVRGCGDVHSHRQRGGLAA